MPDPLPLDDRAERRKSVVGWALFVACDVGLILLLLFSDRTTPNLEPLPPATTQAATNPK